MTIWALSPLLLVAKPDLFGLVDPARDVSDFWRNTGVLWLAIGIGGLLFRTLHLFYLQDAKTGLAWCAKILTDPFHDVKLYYRSPIYLLKGELVDPNHARHHA
jgi:hypothetical protein